MADNQKLDDFVAGQTLLDVGGTTTTGLDLFVAGQLYEAMESSVASDPFVGQAGGGLQVTTVPQTQTTTLEAGGALASATTSELNTIITLSAGGSAAHTVTIPTVLSAVNQQAGGSLQAITTKFIPGAIVPGAMSLLGVGR